MSISASRSLGRRASLAVIAHRRFASGPFVPAHPARNGRGRVASAIFTITAHQLHRLLQTRTPRRLAGDFRTARAKAMRPLHFARRRYKPHTLRCRITRANPLAFPHDRNIDRNHNKGATRTKIIGLPFNWSQQMRLETMAIPAANTLRHILRLHWPFAWPRAALHA